MYVERQTGAYTPIRVRHVENSGPDAALAPTVSAMPRRPHALVAPLLVLAMVGCTPTTALPPASPPSEEAPLFASDEEALAAATEAYEEFLAVSSQILQDGGRDPERLLPLVSDEVYETELEGFTEVDSRDLSVSGSSIATDTQLQQHISGAAGLAEVIIYVCVDVSATDVSDSNGTSLVDPDRPSHLAFEAGFVSDQDGHLTLNSKSIWETESVCGDS